MDQSSSYFLSHTENWIFTHYDHQDFVAISDWIFWFFNTLLHRIFLLLTGKYDPGSRDPIEDALYQRERCRRAKRALEDSTYMPKVCRR